MNRGSISTTNRHDSATNHRRETPSRHTRPLLLAAIGAMMMTVGEVFGAASDDVTATAWISNPGFETTAGGRAAGWAPYEGGYALDTAVRREGKTSIRIRNADTSGRKGAVARILLNQTSPVPLLVTGWSRSEEVNGSPDPDYSLYVDLEYDDGSPLWGQSAAFDTGTHDWQRKRVLIVPARPIRSASIYALFRGHSGTAWFDDVSAVSLPAGASFDSQALRPPRLPAGTTSGWFARDVAADSPLLPLLAADGCESPDAKRLRLRLSRPKVEGSGRRISCVVEDTSGTDRAITVYYVERFPAEGAVWWEDIRRKSPVGAGGERSNQVRIGAGAVGTQSLYPFGCVTNSRRGRALGIAPEMNPIVARIGYHVESSLLFVACDLALTTRNEANRSPSGAATARLSLVRYGVDPKWGFRSAASSYYRLFPDHYSRRARAEGIWIPFTSPGTVREPSDFGIAYHEGDNSVASDDRLGILSFRYTEPMTYWLPMPESVPRTYEKAMEMIREHAGGTDASKRRWAQAVLSSGSIDASGRYHMEFRNTPWANGAVIALNPNPRLKADPALMTKARLNYTVEDADRRYGPGASGVLDGEYLDSIEGWGSILDYRPESARDSAAPPTFEPDNPKPVTPIWFSVVEATAFLRDDLHRRGKLLMANATPLSFHAFAPLLDIMGVETNWLPGRQWQPDSDALFCLRRTLCYQKPYLLLQNTDFDAFGPYVERYFQRSMFYGIYPSFFSIDASTNPYWAAPKWYDRDRPLFRRYIPAVQALSIAGWEPITHARTDRENVYVERFGSRCLTVMNDGTASANATVTLEPEWPGLSSMTARPLRVREIVDGREIARLPSGTDRRFAVSLRPGEALALEIVADGAE